MPIKIINGKTVNTAPTPLKEKFLYRFMGRNAVANALIKALQETVSPKDLVASCLTCIHHEKMTNDDGTEYAFCKLYQSEPPLHIVVHACPSYEDTDDEIPF
jgi:hypothetical protein